MQFCPDQVFHKFHHSNNFSLIMDCCQKLVILYYSNLDPR
ncbi:MAG: hypothetical protein EBT86_00075 [Actinobacteria bacterium]|nr:hypothetical protein [Actinomycetota bacterium]